MCRKEDDIRIRFYNSQIMGTEGRDSITENKFNVTAKTTFKLHFFPLFRIDCEIEKVS